VTLNKIIKDPNAIKFYTLNWSRWLNDGETIASSEWSIESGDGALEIGTGSRASTNDSTTATVWLTGGTVATRYTIRNRIITSSNPSRTDDRSLTVVVQNL
jgi:hypothetical protein